MHLKTLEQQAGRPPFRRDGRSLASTEAGDAPLADARRLVALNDEAAASFGATMVEALVRMGVAQDYFDDVVPDAIARFEDRRPGVHLEVRAGRNFALEEEVRSGRLDVAVAYFLPGPDGHGTRLGSLPLFWSGGGPPEPLDAGGSLPLMLFDHPCLFRQVALQSLERARRPWRVALTTPSLSGVWAALRPGHGATDRTGHKVPAGARNVGVECRLPDLPAIELRLLAADGLSPAAAELRAILEAVVRERVVGL